MKRFYRLFVFSSALLLSGCTSDQNVEQLKVQNTVLQQEIQSQKTQNTTVPTNTYKPTTKSNTNTYPYNTQERKVDVPSPEPIYNNTNNEPVENDYSQKTSCCKVCSKGKACGDSCISRSYTCHKGPGCACDG